MQDENYVFPVSERLHGSMEDRPITRPPSRHAIRSVNKILLAHIALSRLRANQATEPFHRSLNLGLKGFSPHFLLHTANRFAPFELHLTIVGEFATFLPWITGETQFTPTAMGGFTPRDNGICL
jgi:hypothetical protein